MNYEIWPHIAEKLRFFISYSSKEKEIAGALKKVLEEYGVEVFVAHDDITPSDEWVGAIIGNLHNTHVFIPLLSYNFLHSEWTDQEIGIAFALNKYIIPVKIDIDPKGFIRDLQALKTGELDDTEIFKIGAEIISIIDGIDKHAYDAYEMNFHELLYNSIIIKFILSDSFESAKNNYRILSRYADNFNPEQLNALFYWSMRNGQIYDNFTACPYIKSLYAEKEEIIDEDIKAEFPGFMKNHPPR